MIGAALFPLLSFSCQTQPTFDLATASVRQAVQSTTVTLSYSLPANWSGERTVIVGTERVDIANRAKVIGTNAVIASLGTESLHVGVGTTVPSIWAAKGVQLSNNSHVTGTIESGVAPNVGSNVTLSEPITVRTAAQVFRNQSLVADFGSCLNNILLEPNQQRAIRASSWGDVFVKQGATLHLVPGTYNLKSLYVEPGGKLVVHSEGDSTQIFVQHSLTYRGTVTYWAAETGLQFFVAGDDVTIDGPLHANIIAPNARIALNYVNSPFTGTLYGRVIYVAPDVTVVHQLPTVVAGLPTANSEEGPTLEELNLPTTAGTPPNMLDSTRSAATRANDFISWVQQSTPSDATAARFEIAKVRGNANMVSALVSETRYSIQGAEKSRALVALEVLTELDAPESEAFFTTLLTQSAPTGGVVDESTQRTHEQMFFSMLQGKAALGLGWLRTATSRQTLKSAAVAHPDPHVRSQAIRAFVLYYGTEGQAELQPLLDANSLPLVDRIESTNTDGRPYAVREAEYLGKHPNVVTTAMVIPADDPSKICNVTE